jgi:hypothetical protein
MSRRPRHQYNESAFVEHAGRGQGSGPFNDPLGERQQLPATPSLDSSTARGLTFLAR